MQWLAPGGFFGSYQLLEEVGSGGAARVFRARHVHPAYAERALALKVLRPDAIFEGDVVQRFRREAYLLSMLKHPNVVETFDAGVEGADIYIAMEYVDGRDLHALLSEWGDAPLPQAVAVHIAGQILEALHYAHSLKDSGGTPINVVHLDIKPANVLLSYDGTVKLTDFGVAGVLKGREPVSNGGIVGTKGYFAPEMLEGDPVDHRADVFAVGILLYEMLCGRALFDAEQTTKVYAQNVDARIPKPRRKNPSIRRELEAVLLRALKRKPGRRYSSCAAMLEALRPFLPHPASMSLGVAALMRRLFMNDPLWNRRMRQGQEEPEGRRAHVAVCSPDRETLGTVAEQLRSAAYTVDTYASPHALLTALNNGAFLGGLVVDVGSPGDLPPELVAILTARTDMVPVVALCDDLAPETVDAAARLGVADLVVKPPQPERIIWAVRHAVEQASTPPTSGSSRGQGTGARVRLLLVCKEQPIVARLTEQLAHAGYRVDTAATAEEALHRGETVTYHGVIYDQHDQQMDLMPFAAQFRGVVGMGLVPVVWLVAGAEEGEPVQRGVTQSPNSVATPQRCAVRPRQSPAAGVAAALAELLRTTHLGRTFQRYPVSLRGELRFGGRVVQARVTSLSRGGVMLTCSRIPPVNTAVAVTLWLDEKGTPLELPGVAVQVQLPAGEPHAGLRIAFTCGDSTRGEHRLNDVIRRLAAEAACGLADGPLARMR